MLDDLAVEGLPAAVMDKAQVAFALSTHELLEGYVSERLQKPLDESAATYTYLSEFLQLLETVGVESTEQAVYSDTVLLVKCFAATVLASTDDAEHTLAIVDWIQTVDTVVGRWPPDAFNQLEALEDPMTTPWFWDFVQNCVLCGRFEEASKLILRSAQSTSADLQDLVWLLEAYPITSKYASFVQWRQNALALHNNLRERTTANALEKNLLPLVSILTGDVDSINSAAESWMTGLAALYLFNDPTGEMLSHHFATAIRKNAVNTDITWEEGCQALFESRVVAALSCLRALDLTSAIAVTEFCSEHGVLEKYAATSGKAGGGIRERLAIQYARVCLAEPDLVEIGAELLANVATPMAKDAASTLLPELVKRSPSSVPLSIALTQQLGLPQLRQKLCHIAAEVASAEKRYVGAIKYLYEANDLSTMRDASLQFFTEVLVARKPVGGADVAELSASTWHDSAASLPMAVRDCIAPSAVLLQYLQALDAAGAAVGSQTAWATLLREIATNLEALLKFSAQYPEFYPLLVALAGDLSGEAMTKDTAVLLMQSLSEWDDASTDAKEKSYSLISDAMQNPEWQKVLHPGYRPTEVVWLLRRHLAKEVVL